MSTAEIVIDGRPFEILSLEVVSIEGAGASEASVSHVRMAAPVRPTETFVVCESAEAAADEASPTFPNLGAAIDFATDVAGTAAGANVEIWRRDRFGAGGRLVTFRSHVAVTEHWHDASAAVAASEHRS
jgi:hypothetical protein